MKSIHKILGLAISCILVISSCKKEEKAVSPPIPGNEFLTTVKLKLVNKADASDTLTAIWKDLTPDDNNPPDTSKAILSLKKNAVYTMEVTLLDETKNPATDISEAIKEKANHHLFFFFPSTSLGSNLSVKRTDHDTNNPPLELGLTDELTTVNSSTGRLEVVLRHQPNSKNGTFGPGSTDADVFYQVNIQ